MYLKYKTKDDSMFSYYKLTVDIKPKTCSTRLFVCSHLQSIARSPELNRENFVVIIIVMIMCASTKEHQQQQHQPESMQTLADNTIPPLHSSDEILVN